MAVEEGRREMAVEEGGWQWRRLRWRWTGGGGGGELEVERWRWWWGGSQQDTSLQAPVPDLQS